MKRFAHIKLNPNISELIGLHIGDGTLYKTRWSLVWELRGALNEKEYYDKYITKLLNQMFKIVFKPKFRSGGKSGCYGIQTSKKEITLFFLKYGFKPGKKTYTVRIPNYIMNSDRKIKLSLIRGLFDTDGCLRFDKNHGKIRKYPKIEFGFASKKLVDDLSILLKQLGFIYHRWKSRTTYKLCIPGRNMMHKWMREVSPKNTKHLNKYFFYLNKKYL